MEDKPQEEPRRYVIPVVIPVEVLVLVEIEDFYTNKIAPDERGYFYDVS